MRKRIILWLLSFCVMVPLLHAREVLLKFSAVEFLGGSNIICLPNGTEIELSRKYSSDGLKFRLPQTGAFPLYGEGYDPSEKDVKPISQVRVPQGCKSANVLLIPQKASNSYQSIILDDAEMPKGGIYMMNATRSRLGINVGGEEFIVEPSKAKLYKIANNASENKSVKMFRRGEDSKEWKQFYNSKWRLIPGRKEIMIFYRQPNSKSISMRGIRNH